VLGGGGRADAAQLGVASGGKRGPDSCHNDLRLAESNWDCS
jgi:hypothetical protein